MTLDLTDALAAADKLPKRHAAARHIIMRLVAYVRAEQVKHASDKRKRMAGMVASGSLDAARRKLSSIDVGAARRLAAKGVSNAEIARRIGCSLRGLQYMRKREGF